VKVCSCEVGKPLSCADISARNLSKLYRQFFCVWFQSDIKAHLYDSTGIIKITLASKIHLADCFSS